MYYYMIVIEKGKNNYSTYSPDAPGCITTGKSLEETIKNMEEALQFHLEGLYEDGDPIPKPQGLDIHSKEVDAGADDLFTFIRIDPSIFSDAAA